MAKLAFPRRMLLDENKEAQQITDKNSSFMLVFQPLFRGVDCRSQVKKQPSMIDFTMVLKWTHFSITQFGDNSR